MAILVMSALMGLTYATVVPPADTVRVDKTAAGGDIPEGVVAAAVRVVERAAAIDSVWPGFWPEPRPFIVYDGARWSLLFTSDEPLPGYRPTDPQSLPAQLRGRLYLRPGPITLDYLDGSWPGDAPVPPAPVPLVGPTGLQNGYSQEEAILHEAFHFWQLARWPDTHRRQPADCTPQRYETTGWEPPSSFDDAVAIELARLRDAVLASTPQERVDRTQAYLDARRDRLDAVDPLITAIDQRQERREGSAEFTGLAGSLAALHGAGVPLRTALRDTLASHLARLSAGEGLRDFTASQRAAFRAYRAGAATAFLLDALDVESWRSAVARGEFLDVLLARALGADDYIRWHEDIATSQPCMPTSNIDRTATARDYVDSLRGALALPAMSVAVVIDGRAIWAYAAGWADSVASVPATSASVFRIGSVSKLITATAAARLAERGVLDLDGAVRDLVPATPDVVPPITPRHLAGHLGGIRHYGRSDFMNRTRYADVGSSLSCFIADPLVAAPGERYFYSSFGYNLLGAVLERAAGKDFGALMHDEIAAPLGLETMRVADPADGPAEVRYYDRNQQGNLVLAPFVDLSDRWPSGGYVASAPDLARFGSAVFGGSYLGESARALLLTSMRTAAGEATGVGLGWRLGNDGEGRQVAHHGGDAMGSRAFLLVWPDERIAVALLTNLTFAPVGLDEALRIAELIGRGGR